MNVQKMAQVLVRGSLEVGSISKLQELYVYVGVCLGIFIPMDVRVVDRIVTSITAEDLKNEIIFP